MPWRFILKIYNSYISAIAITQRGWPSQSLLLTFLAFSSCFLMASNWAMRSVDCRLSEHLSFGLQKHLKQKKKTKTKKQKWIIKQFPTKYWDISPENPEKCPRMPREISSLVMAQGFPIRWFILKKGDLRSSLAPHGNSVPQSGSVQRPIVHHMHGRVTVAAVVFDRDRTRR